MNVVARGLSFEAPAEVPLGWTTIRFENLSPMVHFVVVERLPEGQGASSQQELVAPVFQRGMDLIAAGDMDGAMAEFGTLPPWFGDIVFMGGPGLTSAGQTSQATVYLEPGTYLLECYVKTAGVFHSYNPDPAILGMVHEFTVTAEASGAVEPSPTLSVRISSASGIEIEGTPSAGTHMVRVDFDDQVVHENFVQHDVHVARIPDGFDLATLEAWMNWVDPAGLQTPSPVEFIGGTNEMPGGTYAYFTVTLTPGTYALVAEVPGALGKGMLQTFTVE
jgi:hypothetical protein